MIASRLSQASLILHTFVMHKMTKLQCNSFPSQVNPHAEHYMYFLTTKLKYLSNRQLSSDIRHMSVVVGVRQCFAYGFYIKVGISILWMQQGLSKRSILRFRADRCASLIDYSRRWTLGAKTYGFMNYGVCGYFHLHKIKCIYALSLTHILRTVRALHYPWVGLQSPR